ncbi:MAG: twin-arginine translocation signal domain-containing protein, partial [Planctomycetota bacterium]
MDNSSENTTRRQFLRDTFWGAALAGLGIGAGFCLGR